MKTQSKDFPVVLVNSIPSADMPRRKRQKMTTKIVLLVNLLCLPILFLALQYSVLYLDTTYNRKDRVQYLILTPAILKNHPILKPVGTPDFTFIGDMGVQELNYKTDGDVKDVFLEAEKYYISMGYRNIVSWQAGDTSGSQSLIENELEGANTGLERLYHNDENNHMISIRNDPDKPDKIEVSYR
jgi:hypothetical protein